MLTAGDLRIAKKRDGKVKFDPDRHDPNVLLPFKKVDDSDDGFDSSDEDEREKKHLFKKCFNKNNIALGRMIRTTETVLSKANKFKADLEKLLIR